MLRLKGRRKSVQGLRGRGWSSSNVSILETLEDRKLLSGMVHTLELQQPPAEVHTLAQAHKPVHHTPVHKVAHKPAHTPMLMPGMPGMVMPKVAPSTPALVNGVIPGTGGAYVSGLPLTQPTDLYSKNGVLSVTMTVTQQVVNISGKKVYAIVYNGSFVGPTLHLSPGDTLKLNLANKANHPPLSRPARFAQRQRRQYLSEHAGRQYLPVCGAHSQNRSNRGELVPLSPDGLFREPGVWRSFGHDRY